MTTSNVLTETTNATTTLEKQVSALDAELAAARTRHFAGELPDRELIALEDRKRIALSRLNVARQLDEATQERNRATERAGRLALLAQLVAGADENAWKKEHDSWAERAREIARSAEILRSEVVSRVTQANVDGRRAEGLARELGVELPSYMPRWATDNAAIYMARAIRKAQVEQGRGHDLSRFLEALGQPVLE